MQKNRANESIFFQIECSEVDLSQKQKDFIVLSFLIVHERVHEKHLVKDVKNLPIVKHVLVALDEFCLDSLEDAFWVLEFNLLDWPSHEQGTWICDQTWLLHYQRELRILSISRISWIKNWQVRLVGALHHLELDLTMNLQVTWL